MLRNYLKTAWRAVVKQKVNTIVNIAGLTLGIAACLVIFLVVKNELSYDAWHTKANRTYRVTLNAIDFNPSVSTAVLPAMRTDFPEIEHSTCVYYMGGVTMKVGDELYAEGEVLVADEQFPAVFDYTWLQGDARTALKDPNTIVLTESMAAKYFGEKNPIGEHIKLDNEQELTVTAVVKDPPANTHLPFRFVVSYATRAQQVNTDRFYAIMGARSYIVLPPDYDVAKLQNNIKPFIEKHWGKGIADEARMPLQPLRDIHFDQRYLFDSNSPTVSRNAYLALAGIALFILITACINFINLATAQAMRRAREVGVRKTLGSNRLQLIWQFMSETAIITGISIFLSVLLTILLLPQTANLLDIKIEANALGQWQVVLLTATLGILVVLMAGLYPAFVQSSFKPAVTLKGSTGGRNTFSLRKSLVVVQFVISQAMIAGTLIVAQQIDFFKNGEMGYDKDAVVSIPMIDPKKAEPLGQQFAGIAGIKDYSFSAGAPVYESGATSFSDPANGLTKDDVTELKMVDERYFDLFKLQLLAGEKVRKVPPTDTIRPVVINSTMLHALGYSDPQQAIGKSYIIGGDVRVTINGVIKDFQLGSKHKAIRPATLLYMPENFFLISIKLAGKDMRKTIAEIERVWSATYPDRVFRYEFLDEHIAGLYRQEEKLYTAFRIFAFIAIFIGCLGLYGLVAFAAAQRTKEVGIRKVLGASAASILGLFGKEFIVLIIIAFCIAVPLSFFVMQKWLSNFAYQVSIGSSAFMITIVVTFVIAAATIAHQALKAAWTNPVKSLKTE